MDQSPSGSALPHEQPHAPQAGAAPQTGAPEAAGNGSAIQLKPVTRRRVLSGGAVIAATAAVAGAENVSEALASSDRKRSTTNGSHRSTKKGASKALRIKVNGQNRVVTYAHNTMLLYVLRDEFHLRGPKFGCGLSQCGACAVLLDGQQIRSCVTPVSSVGTKAVVTLDGLAASYHGKAKAKKGALHPLQQAWIDEQVPQCGYCQSGMIIQAADLLSKTPRPTEAEIKSAMNGHLCRCGTYNGIVRAIQRASKVMAE